MNIRYPSEGDSPMMSDALNRLKNCVVECVTREGERFTGTIRDAYTDDDGWLAFDYNVWCETPDGGERETDDVATARTIDIELMEVS